MVTLRQGFDALAHDEEAKQRHASGEASAELVGHDLDDDLMAEAMAAFAAASPLELADALSDYVLASSPLAADMPAAADGLAALAAVEFRPTSPTSGSSDAGTAGHALARFGALVVATIVTLVVAAIVVLVIVLTRDSDNESSAGAPEATASTAAAPSTSPTPPPVVTEASSTAPPSTESPPTTVVVVAPPIEGRWELAIVVTAVEGAFCGLDEPYKSTVVIGEDDKGQLGVIGLGDKDETWLASFDGTTLTFDGDRFEDDGTTLAFFELDLDGDVLTGSESWSWSGGGNSCDNGMSTVTGARLAG